MEFIIKEHKHKIDPKHPESTDPSYAKDWAKGQENLRNGRMKFENDAERRDYEKKCQSNPANIPGCPAFAPPLQITPSHGFGEGCKTETLPCGKRWKRMAVRKGEIIYMCSDGHEYNSQNKLIN
jgi:hypothetical protein